MTRGKVKLAWIVNDDARKASFTKRRASLVKKVGELAVLCDVSSFIIVYDADSCEPVVLPEPAVVEQLVTRFLNLPDFERWRKMTTQETYLKEKASKFEEEIKRIRKKNNEMEMSDALHNIVQNGKPLHAFEDRELTDLALFLKERMKGIRKHMDYIEKDHNKVSPCDPPREGAEGENMSVSDGRVPTISLFEYLQMEKGKQMENNVGASSSVRGDSSISAANQVELPSNFEGNYFGVGSDLPSNSKGLPPRSL